MSNSKLRGRIALNSEYIITIHHSVSVALLAYKVFLAILLLTEDYVKNPSDCLRYYPLFPIALRS